MIRFGLRLAFTGGREAWVRLGIIAVAVALGVGMVLTAVAGINAVAAQNDRFGWVNSGGRAADAEDALWWDTRIDAYDRQMIGRVDLAATGPGSPVPPGLPRLPGAGEYFASPALAELLSEAPAAHLGNRFPGRMAGTIGPAASPAPDSLIVVVGYDAAELSQRPGVSRAGAFLTTAPTSCPGGCFAGIPTEGMQLIFAVVALGLVFPMVVLIGTATRLAAARREQRFAAMRLVGATPRQVAVVAAAEATVSAVAGTAVGFLLFALFRDRLAAIPFTGEPFFPADLTPGVVGSVVVAVGVPLIAAGAAKAALRRVHISPLGVSRRTTPRAPRAYRLIPLLAGVGLLSWFVGNRPSTTNGQVLAFVPSFLIVMAGLVVAGPWLTLIGARVIARRARRAETLIAARRLADDPGTGFRAVSGLVLALFITTVSVALIGTIAQSRGTGDADADNADLFVYFRDEEKAPGRGEAVRAELAAVPGVLGVSIAHQPAEGTVRPAGDWAPYLLASCADVDRLPQARPCVDGARTAWVYPDLIGADGWTAPWPDAGLAPDEVARLPIEAMTVMTDGSPAAIEGARTVIGNAHPSLWPAVTDAERAWNTARVFHGWQRLAHVVIVVSLVVAGCSLAVSAVGGLSERRRSFSMLRLTGVPLRTLRRVVVLESGTPLLAAAVVAIGAGFLSAHLFLRAQMGYSVRAPEPGYPVVVVAGLAVAIAAIAATMPLLRRITGPEAARNE